MIHLFEKGFKYVASFLYQHVIQTIESEDYHHVAENYINVFFGYGLFEPTLKKLLPSVGFWSINSRNELWGVLIFVNM